MNGAEIHSLLPPIMGIITVNRLGLQWWAKIPAYLMTSLVTREMIEQLEIELPAISGQTPLRPPENLTASSSAVTYTIVHTIPGRIRFHIPRLLKDRKYAQRLMRLARAETRIKQARVNRDTASWVVTYQTGRNGSSQGNNQEMAVAELVTLIQSAAMPSSTSPTLGVEIPSNSLTINPEVASIGLKPNYEPRGLKPNYEPDSKTDSARGLKPNYEPRGLKPNYEPDSKTDSARGLKPNYEPRGLKPNYEPDSKTDSARGLKPNYEPRGLKPNYEPDSKTDSEPDSEPDSDVEAGKNGDRNGEVAPPGTMWNGCKASTLAVMLDLMANLPI